MGEFDCSMLVDNPDFPFMHDLLGLLKLRGSRLMAGVVPRIFQITYRERNAQYAAAARLLKLENFGSTGYHLLPVLYQLRHGGASHELATGRREITALAKRGRWGSLASVRRYERGGRLTELASRLTPAQVDLAELCQSHIGAILCGTCRPVSPGTTARQSPSNSSQVQGVGQRRGGPPTRPGARSSS